jgi:hypothetical protein
VLCEKPLSTDVDVVSFCNFFYRLWQTCCDVGLYEFAIE